MLCLQDHGLGLKDERSLNPWLEGEPAILEMLALGQCLMMVFIREEFALGAALAHWPRPANGLCGCEPQFFSFGTELLLFEIPEQARL